MTGSDAIDSFRSAMASRGLEPSEIIADGEWHRCRTTDGGRKLNGAYRLHLDDRPAGSFKNFADGLPAQNWKARGMFKLDPGYAKKIDELKKSRELEEKQKAQRAAQRASALWFRAQAIGIEHEYLKRKGVGAYAIRLRGDKLLIPLRDTNGVISSLQSIDKDGAKRFLPNGTMKGCYHAIGKPSGLVFIAEGYATAASVHEASGQAVAVAFHAGNLEPVARAIRSKYPNLMIVICADNDAMTLGNPGITLAVAAATAVRGSVAFPPEPGDWNDYAARHGLNEVRRLIRAAYETDHLMRGAS